MSIQIRSFTALFTLVALFCVMNFAWVAAAGEPTTKYVSETEDEKADEEPESDPTPRSRLREFFRRARGERGLSRYLRDHPSVMSAFKESVSQARKSTVVVLNDGDRLAMGTIISEDGYVLTKASQLKEPLECRLSDGRRLEAEIVGVHRDTDLAMVKVEQEGLPVIRWSAEKTPVVGSFLATTGQDEVPLAIGVVSAVPRRITAPPPMLGIQLDEDSKGPRVDRVLPNSAAEKAGVLVNDIVVSLNGRKPDSVQNLIQMIRQLRSGDRVNLEVARGDERKKISATLGSFDDLNSLSPGSFQNQLGGPLSRRRSGFSSALQHDTVLKPQDCGGPVVGLDGQAIGVNIARDTRVSSLALPIQAIRPIIAELKSGKLTSAISTIRGEPIE